jgi:type VI secretion system protein ImpC
MPQPSRSSVHLDVAPGERRGAEVEPDEPFRILIMGDFSGRANRRVREPLAGRRPVFIDRDNVDDVLASLQPALNVSGVEMKFAELDDFHPDRLYRRLDVFQKLREERHRPISPPASLSRPVPRRAPDLGGGSLLDSLIDEANEEVAAPQATGDLADFIKKVMAPHLVPREDPRQKAQEAHADSVASVAMRTLLHAPEFQAIEAGWRAVDLLTRRLETDELLKLYLFDATLDELASDPAGVDRLIASPNTPWALIVGNYSFGQGAGYAKVLSMIGRSARAANAPFIAEAVPPSGTPEGPEWAELRRSDEARWIGLALPRFLVRLPYGRRTSPVESFEFDEMPETRHQDYLWANPAFCCACLIGQSFSSDGWNLRLGTNRRLDGIPLHTYTESGETRLKPCAEVLMTEKEAEYLMDQGIMPLASMKDQDAVLLVRFQSIANPVRALAGRWTA